MHEFEKGMSMTQFRSMGPYHFGSEAALSDKQAMQLISSFRKEKATPPSLLGGRCPIQRCVIDGLGSVVIKTYMRGGIIRYFNKNKYVKHGKTRGHQEYDLLCRVRTLGIRCPEPLAFAFKGKRIYQTWLITREIDHHQTLAQLSLTDMTAAKFLMPEIIHQVSLLAANQIHHVDLHPGNIIIQDKKVYIIDFDKGYQYTGSASHLKKKYTARWNRAVVKHHLPKMLIDDMRF
jgi:tRNA A-37 threonylcarbamoyl transferase component Bud32